MLLDHRFNEAILLLSRVSYQVNETLSDTLLSNFLATHYERIEIAEKEHLMTDKRARFRNKEIQLPHYTGTTH